MMSPFARVGYLMSRIFDTGCKFNVKQHLLRIHDQDHKLDPVTLGLIIEEVRDDVWLKSLELHHVRFTVDDMTRLGRALENNSQLINLELVGSQIDDGKLCAMIRNMKKRSSLSRIDLTNNLIDERGYLAMYHFQQAHPTLKRVCMADNPVINRGPFVIQTPIGPF